MTWGRYRALGAIAVATTIASMQACAASSSKNEKGGATNANASSSTSDSSSSAGGNGGSSSSNGGGFTTSSSASTGGGGQACAATTAEAQEGTLPADIIIAVDTSGSMSDEAQWTQQNMNAMAQLIIDSGINVHVIMISSNDICVPMDLGSGSCPDDENLPIYRHVQQSVGSNDALEKILDTYPQYQASLRPGATKTIVVISDDNSDMSASAFTSNLLALDPTFQGFKFDAIYSYQDPAACLSACLPNFCQGCGKCCSNCPEAHSAAQGTVYAQLVQQTGGVQGDLCDQDFVGVFQDMATGVVVSGQLACVYDIPEPPEGETLDYDKVNVEYAPDGNTPADPIFYVPGGAPDCASGGWYYDDPSAPTQIILCPSSCDQIQGNPNGQVSIALGCDTLVGPPA